MRQSQTYRRSQKDFGIDYDSYKSYRMAVAMRILRKNRRTIGMEDAWQLAAIPASFLWVFRRPISFFKRKKVASSITRKLRKVK